VAISVKVSGIDIPQGCSSLETSWSLNTGLNEVARLRVEGDGISCDSHCDSIGKPTLITVGDHAPFTLSLAGIDRAPLHLNASITLRARSREAAIRGNDNLTWTKPDTLSPSVGTIGPNVSYASFEFQPDWNSAGKITVDATLDGSEPVMSAELVYRTAVPWWILLVSCLGGALSYVSLRIIVRHKGNLSRFWPDFSRNGYAQPVLACCAGLAGFCLKRVEFVDLKITSSDWLGCLVLGAAFAAIGLEPLLNFLAHGATLERGSDKGASAKATP
jgi:hypothetical protein